MLRFALSAPLIAWLMATSDLNLQTKLSAVGLPFIEGPDDAPEGER